MVVVIFLLSVFALKTAVNAESSLVDAQNYQSSNKTLSLWPRDSRTGARCNTHNFVVRKSHLGFTKKFGRVVPAYHNKIEVNDSCAIKTRFGYVSSSIGGKTYLELTGQPIAGEIVGHAFRHILPLPDSQHMLVSGDYFKTLYKVDDVAKTVSTAVTLDNQIKYTLNVTNERFDCLEDYKCQLDTIGHTASSYDGVMLTAHIPNFGMVKLNTESMSYQSFGKPSVYSRAGATPPYRYMSTSASGKYAAVYYSGEKELFVYDLENCQPNFELNKPDICDSIDLTEYADEIGLDLATIHHLGFNRSGNLYIYSKNSNDNLYTMYEIASSEGSLTGDVSYVAMGDSFASGEGDLDASWYELGTDVSENKCHLSRRSYPYLIATQLELSNFHSVACSGAVIEDVLHKSQSGDLSSITNLGDWHPGIKPQVEYMDYEIPKLITLSVAGNDAGFSGKLTECVIGIDTCKYAEEGENRSNVAKEITKLYDSLVETYEAVSENTEQNTKILVVGYPKFIKATGGSCGLNVHLNDSERVFIDRAVVYMNQVIKAAVRDAGVEYVDIEDALEGQNLCSEIDDSLMAVNGLTKGNDILFWALGNESFHPNPIGHELIKQNLLNSTGYSPEGYGVCGVSTGACNPGPRSLPLPALDYWGQSAVDYATTLGNDPNQELPSHPRNLKMIVSGAVGSAIKHTTGVLDVVIKGLKPSSWVDFVLQSDPVSLGSYQANEFGELRVELAIPEVVKPGIHTVNAYTTNILNEQNHFYEHIAYINRDGLDSECGLVVASGTDFDDDGIDDACDAVYVRRINEEEVVLSETNINEIIPSETTTETNSAEDVSSFDENSFSQNYNQIAQTADDPSATMGARNSTVDIFGVANDIENSTENSIFWQWILAIVAFMISGSVIIYTKVKE